LGGLSLVRTIGVNVWDDEAGGTLDIVPSTFEKVISIPDAPPRTHA
jgi:hypothetical protein